MLTFKSRIAAASGVLALVLSLAATSASAESGAATANDGKLPVAVANPELPQSVIDGLPPVVQQSSTIIDLETFNPNSPMVYPDGRTVPGQSAEKLAKLEAFWKKGAEKLGTTERSAATLAATCELTVTAPLGGAWAGVSTCYVVVFGHEGYVRYFKWSRKVGTSGSGCLQARTHTTVTGGATAVWWVDIGCGTSGGGNVNWGNHTANPAVRARSASSTLGFSAVWQT